MLDAWWKHKMALSTGTGPASVEQVLDFPSPVLDSMRELWQSALRRFERIAEVGIETARGQLEEGRAELQAGAAALGQRERSLEASRASMEETLATKREVLTTAQRPDRLTLRGPDSPRALDAPDRRDAPRVRGQQRRPCQVTQAAAAGTT